MSAMPMSNLGAGTQLLPWSTLGDVKSSVGIPTELPYWELFLLDKALGPKM